MVQTDGHMRNPDMIQMRAVDPAGAPPGWTLRCVARCQARPGERYDRPDHDHHTIELVEHGRGTVEVGDESATCGPGDAYLLPAGAGHVISADRKQPWRKLFCNYTGPLLDHLRTAYGLGGRCIFPAAAIGGPLRRLLTFDGTDAALQLQAAPALAEILGILRTSLDPGLPPVVDAAKRFIDANLERPIRLADIATAAACSEGHCSRSFRAALGRSPGDYLIVRRMELAKALLGSTAEPIKAIAARLCYRDAFAFSHAFKVQVGCAPSTWRRRAGV